MGLFGNKKPKLPSYVGAGLDALLQDPEWASAISQAGIDAKRCEIVLRLADPTVGTGGCPGESDARDLVRSRQHPGPSVPGGARDQGNKA
jgi:hypothetical protein